MRIRAAVVFTLWLAGCHAGEEPGSGRLDVVLEVSTIADGAIVITLSGGPVGDVDAPGHDVTRYEDDRGVHLLVVGDLTAGRLLSVDIPDMGRARAYVATIEQVADGATFALHDPGSMRIAVAGAE